LLVAADTAIPQAMLRPFPSQLMTAYPVSTKINSVKNDTLDVSEPAA
jgi:putative SOS response-associated peptidase YedK